MTSPAPTDGSVRPTVAAIVFAMPIEADAFERLVTGRVELATERLRLQTGTVAGRSVAWGVSGVGERLADQAARLLVAGHRPRALISAGFAGALTLGFERGQLAYPTRTVVDDGSEPIALASGSDGDGATTIVTVDRVIGDVDAKRRLADASGAGLVDMESHAVAKVAIAEGIPCYGVRVVSDTADQALPREIASLASPQSPWRRLGATLGAVTRRPAVIGDLWHLWEHAVVDGRTLAAGLAGLIASLPDD